jgi:two-component system, LuxR family, response regulator FixJ
VHASPEESNMTPEATVFCVDDDVGMRRSLRALMESAGLAVEAYATSEEFLAACDDERPGCLVLDVQLGCASGLDLQEELRRRNWLLPVIVLTGHGNVPTSVRALKTGAFDFLEKPAPPDVLLGRVRAAIEADRRARLEKVRRAEVAVRMARLTRREREVMDMLVAGRSSKQIAAALRLSVRTVEVHRRMVLLKMNVSSAVQLVRAVLGLHG